MTVAQAAELAGVSRQSILRWKDAGRLPVAEWVYGRTGRAGPTYYFRPDDVRAAAVPPAPPTREQRAAWGRMGGRPRKA